MTDVLRALLPAEVEVEETTSDFVAASPFAKERAVVARAVTARRAEFFSTRECARRALMRLGMPASPIVPGQHREPMWPEGVVGSLTHCDGYRAAAVARESTIAAIGIDAEPHGPLPHGVANLVMLDDERPHLAVLAATAREISWDKILFSAKESVFKAWFPVTRMWLDFTECEIRIDPEAGTFAAEILVSGPHFGTQRLDGFGGHWAVVGNLVVTSVCVLRS